jgi:hypothetical protein
MEINPLDRTPPEPVKNLRDELLRHQLDFAELIEEAKDFESLTAEKRTDLSARMRAKHQAAKRCKEQLAEMEQHWREDRRREKDI